MVENSQPIYYSIRGAEQSYFNRIPLKLLLYFFYYNFYPMKKVVNVALYGGAFDPPHKSHLSIIRELLNIEFVD